MRYLARTAVLAVALVCSTALPGCRELEYHFGSLALHPPETARPAKTRRTTRPVVKRVTEPKFVQAGAKIRSFCGQRHVRFQAGALKETDTEKARNDALCRQVY